MKRTRIDFDNDGGDFARLVNLAADYQRAVTADQWPHAAGAMHQIEDLAERLTDDALVRADEQTPRQRHQIARDMGLVHGTVNNRIKRARARQRAESDTAREGATMPTGHMETRTRMCHGCSGSGCNDCGGSGVQEVRVWVQD
ncbi:hypothetical protein ACWDKQ_34545 [Saccharopolyspora sp. NPDC000995]